MSITKTPTSMIDPTGATAGDVLTFNNSTNTWVASGLSAQGFSASLSSNGYQKLPSGLIMQWGVLSAVYLDEYTYHVTDFPITFPNQVFNVTATLSYLEPVNASIGMVIRKFTTSSLTAWGDHGVGGGQTTGNIYWQAIGY
jgi:hypothetical protein